MKSSAVKAHNMKEAKMFKDYLDTLTKFVVFKIVNDTLISLMMPNARNYSSFGFMGGGFPDGPLVVHDSSNAAWNWSVNIGGGVKPYEHRKGRSPVGMSGDERSTNDPSSAYSTIDVKRDKDISSMLKGQLFRKSGKIPKISISNPISGEYATRANLKSALAVADSYAARSEYSTQSYINQFHLFTGTPNKQLFVQDISYITSQSIASQNTGAKI